MAKEYNCRPSAIYGCQNTLAAFYLDRVVMNVGTQIQSEIEKAQNGKKTERAMDMAAQLVLNRWMRSEGAARYRDPAKG